MGSCTGPTWPRRPVFFLHFLYPLLTILYFLLTRITSTSALRRLSPANNSPSFKPGFVIWFMLGIFSTYVGEAILVFRESGLPSGRITRDLMFYTLSSSVVWAMQAVSLLISSNHPVWYPYWGCWAIAFVPELFFMIFEDERCPPVTSTEFTQLAIQMIRFCALSILVALFFSTGASTEGDTQVDEESQSLLAGKVRAPNGAKDDGPLGLTYSHQQSYGGVHIAGTATGIANDAQSSPGADITNLRDVVECDQKAPSTAQCIWNLFLFVWPTGHIWLQLSFIGIGLCVIVGRVLKVLVLYQLGKIVDILNTRSGRFPWFELSLYVLYRWLDSSAGLGAVKRLLWAPVEAESYRSINTAAFAHLMKLSSDSYEHNRSRKVMDSTNYGRTITRLVNVGTFEALPTFFDIFIVIGYLCLLFDASLGSMIALVTVTYLWMTSNLYTADKDKRRDLNKSAECESKLIHQVINAWQTVLIYNQTSYEMERHSSAVETHAGALRDSRISHCVLLAIQSSITCVGLLAASLLAAYQVAQGHKPTGNLVILLAYWIGMSGTLYSITLNWQCLKADLVVAKGLLALFQTQPTVRNQQAPQQLVVYAGAVCFEDVSFGYESGSLVLENINFLARPNSKVVFVGMPEAGKSTILKLLFRLYDVTSGMIQIDDQDIRNVTIDSLRERVGVISKDCELFNDSILNNIRYAKLNSPDQEVFDACELAGIHEKILTFSDGYYTRVGEHGQTLSEMDLRRISIARVFLKDPQILLLDEPTSWADDEVDNPIHKAIDDLTLGRTTFVAARQKPTMMDADRVYVLQDGKIVEQGLHWQLLGKKGVYYTMFQSQKVLRTQKMRKVSIENATAGLRARRKTSIKRQNETEDTSLPPLNPDLVHKTASVSEDKQTTTAVAHDLDHANSKALPVLENTQTTTAVARDLNHGDHKTAAVLEDNHLKNAVAHDLNQTKAEDPVAEVRNSPNGKLEKDTISAQDKWAKGKGRWKPDAPEFIPKNMHVLIYNKDCLSKENPLSHEKIIQTDPKNEIGNEIDVKKDGIRQDLSDITNRKPSGVDINKTATVEVQSDADKNAIPSNETERTATLSESNKEGGDILDAKDKAIEKNKSDIVNRNANTVDMKKDGSQQDQSDVDKETGNVLIINDDDSEPKQSDIEQTNRPSEKAEIQAAPPNTNSSGNQVDEAKEPAASDVKQHKRRSRNKNRASKRRQKSTSEESSASQMQEKGTKDSSKLGSSLGEEPTKADDTAKTTTTPTAKDKEDDKLHVKKVRFRGGPQSQSEPSREGSNNDAKPLHSSMRSFPGDSSGGQDHRDSTSSDIPSSTPGQSGPSSGHRRQHSKGRKGKKSADRKKSESDSTTSTGAVVQKETA